MADHVYVGADKECGACGSPMAAIANNSTNCGCGLDDDGTVRRMDAPKKAAPPPPKKAGIHKGIVLAIGGILGWGQVPYTLIPQAGTEHTGPLRASTSPDRGDHRHSGPRARWASGFSVIGRTPALERPLAVAVVRLVDGSWPERLQDAHRSSHGGPRAGASSGGAASRPRWARSSHAMVPGGTAGRRTWRLGGVLAADHPRSGGSSAR